MHTYRIFKLDGMNRIVGPPIIVQCDTDEQAIGEMRSLLAVLRAAELWQGDRFLGRFAQD